LLQLQEKNWCPPEQVGYLLQAMNDLVGDLHKVVWGKRFDMGKYLRDLRKESGEKLLKVDEVADMLRVKKLTVYRMVKDKKLNVINLPIGRGRKGELRIPQEEVDKILGRHSAEGTE
jgi:excisionase family DNA binding protein